MSNNFFPNGSKLNQGKMKKEYPTITFVIQILGKSMSHLLTTLFLFTFHLFTVEAHLTMNSFLFYANKQSSKYVLSENPPNKHLL